MLAFYTDILVPIFATVAVYISVRREVVDRFRNNPTVTIALQGAVLMVRNQSPFAVFLARYCYLTDDYYVRNAVVMEVVEGRYPDTKIEPRAHSQIMVQTEHKGYPLHVYQGCKDRPQGWAVQLQSGEWFTTLPWWRQVARARFRLKNRA